MTDEHWFPLYEKLIELDVPAMIRVSASVNPAAHTLGGHYLNAGTTVFMQLVSGDLFTRFPGLRFVIPARRRRALPLGPLPRPGHQGEAPADRNPRDAECLLRHLCLPPARHRPADICHPADNILFASKMLGAMRGDNLDTGASWDDTKRYVDKAGRSEDNLRKIYELNARRVYPRLDPRLGLAKRNHFWSSIAANCRQGSGQ